MAAHLSPRPETVQSTPFVTPGPRNSLLDTPFTLIPVTLKAKEKEGLMYGTTSPHVHQYIIVHWIAMTSIVHDTSFVLSDVPISDATDTATQTGSSVAIYNATVDPTIRELTLPGSETDDGASFLVKPHAGR